jgi:hypothetical protein
VGNSNLGEFKELIFTIERYNGDWVWIRSSSVVKAGYRGAWLHGIEKIRKRYLIAAAAHNLGLLMRVLFKMGTPRGLQAAADIASSMYLAILTLCKRILRLEFAFETATARYLAPWAAPTRVAARAENVRNSTAC